MKIAFVLECANLDTNGTTASCVRFAKKLHERGHEVIILGCNYINKENPDYYVGFEKYKFPVFDRLITKEGFQFVKIDVKKMDAAIKDCDLVHLFLPFKFQNIARLLAYYHKIPVTAAFHLQPQNITSAVHLGKAKFINNLLYHSFNQYMFKWVNHIHCPSEMIKKELERHHYHNTCHVISNGIIDYWHKVEAKRPEELKNKFIITMSGRLSDEKRQDLLLKAVSISKYNEKIQIILCGQGPRKDHYEKLANRLNLANNPIIKFCDREELRKTLSYSDLFVHASDFEIEGISCIEAFSCGLVPVISNAKYSASSDFSLDDRCIFNHGSKKSLKERIEFFYENPKLLKELGKKYEESAKKYQIDKMVDKMEEMFNEAIKEKVVVSRKKDIRKINKLVKIINK